MLIEVMKKVYDEVYGKYGDGKVNDILDMREIEGKVRDIKAFVLLLEDGLTWKAIKDHIEKGCHCKELKGEEARQALEEGVK